MRSFSLSLLALPLLGACSNLPVMCTDVALPAIIVNVQDSITGANLLVGTRGVVQDGAYVDSLHLYSPGSLQAATERAGTYALTVVHVGYADWSRSSIRVSRDACHVQTVTVQARLKPFP